MELIITIPKEFEAHFKQDKFKDSLGRICYDIENAYKKHEGVSSRYEHELAEMIDDAFAKAQVSPNEAELKRTKRALWIARADCADSIANHFATLDSYDCYSLFNLLFQTIPSKGFHTLKSPYEWQRIFKMVAERCRAYADKFKEE